MRQRKDKPKDCCLIRPSLFWPTLATLIMAMVFMCLVSVEKYSQGEVALGINGQTNASGRSAPQIRAGQTLRTLRPPAAVKGLKGVL